MARPPRVGYRGAHGRAAITTSARRRGVDRRVLLAAIVLVLIAAVGGGLLVLRGGGATAATTTVWQAITNGVKGGVVPKDAALQAFAYAYRVQVPGVTLPTGTDANDGPTSGTGPMRWVQAHWSELSPDQQQVIGRYAARGPADTVRTIQTAAVAPDPAAAAEPREAAIAPFGLAVVRPPVIGAPDGTSGPSSQVEALFEAAVRDAVGHIGARLGLPRIGVADIVYSDVDGGNTFFTTFACRGNELSDLTRECGYLSGFTPCNIVVWKNSWSGLTTMGPETRTELTHEVVHCYQNTVFGDLATVNRAPAWITEGTALWLSADDTRVREPMVDSQWKKGWFGFPSKDLIDRTYDSYGYFALLDHLRRDLWGRMASAWRAVKGAGGGDPATPFLAVLDGDASDVREAWAPSLLNEPAWNDPWIAYGFGLPSGIKPASQSLYAVENQQPQDLVGRSAVVGNVITSSGEIVLVESTGLANAHGGAASGAAYLGFGSKRLCVLGDCVCPKGTDRAGERVADADIMLPFAVAFHGGPGAWSWNVSALKMENECKRKPTPRPTVPQSAGPGGSGGRPCQTGCAGSNGDPHLITVDNRAYDFMAAGEFTLLRSSDGTVDVQARQEPFRDKKSVSINTAVATRVNGHRVVVSMGSPLKVSLDGAPATGAATTDLGNGFRIFRHAVGIEVPLPDGSVLWAIGLGNYGINVQIRPSEPLRESGVGILARVPPNALGIPALPDGTALPRTLDRHLRFQTVYGRFADAWRITAATSLFDYEPGKSTGDYTVAGFPAEDGPQSLGDLSATQVAQGQQACGSVTDPVLRDQCAFDLAVTGESGFVQLYGSTLVFQQRGPTGLDQLPSPPPSASPSASAGGQPPLQPVIAGLKSVRGQAVAPDGTVYLSVVHPDGRNEVLAVDSATSKIVRRVDGKGGGQVAFAAGSVWVADLAGPPACTISRLDPATLAVQATIPAACTSFFTTIAATDEGVWFQDPTGADAQGAGGHIRHIDPATNTIDRSVDRPPSLLDGRLHASGTTLFYVDFDAKWHRLRAGATAFDPIGATGSFGAPVDDGVWTQANGSDKPADYYTGPGPATRSVPIFGGLEGADRGSVLVEGIDEATNSLSLLRYPIDGSVPTVLARSPAFLDDGIQRPLPFHGARPLTIVTGAAIAVWQVPSNKFTEMTVYVASVPLP